MPDDGIRNGLTADMVLTTAQQKIFDETLARRMVTLEGVTNYRDVGGYPAHGGKTVRWDRLYRSGDLFALSDNDLAKLAASGLKTIVDFRSAFEAKADPDRVPASVTRVCPLSIDPGDVFAMEDAMDGDGAHLMERLNVVLVNEAKEQYAEFFRLLMNGGNMPLLFHCSAGKDRTGLAAALFLAALGVAREFIYADYLLSAGYAEEKYRHILTHHPELLPVITVKQEYLAAAFAEIDAKYGGLGNYLTGELGVDIDLLRDLYTV